MRAEAQTHIDEISAATALLRRFLDWDRAQRRLEELNAKVEEPALWDDPKAAQEVMRERRRLDEAINATKAIERELSDTAELIEMAEAEGDEALVDEGVRSLADLAARAERDKVAALLADGQGTRIVRKIVRKAKGDRVGVAMADITVCGAVAPYNAILGGKLVAMLSAGPELVRACALQPRVPRAIRQAELKRLQIKPREIQQIEAYLRTLSAPNRPSCPPTSTRCSPAWAR